MDRKCFSALNANKQGLQSVEKKAKQMQKEKGGAGESPAVRDMYAKCCYRPSIATDITLLTITACVFHVTDQSVSFHTCVLPKGGPCSTTRNSADTDSIVLGGVSGCLQLSVAYTDCSFFLFLFFKLICFQKVP